MSQKSTTRTMLPARRRPDGWSVTLASLERYLDTARSSGAGDGHPVYLRRTPVGEMHLLIVTKEDE